MNSGWKLSLKYNDDLYLDTRRMNHGARLQGAGLTYQHFIHNDPQTPPVTALSIASLHEHFRGNVVWCPYSWVGEGPPIFFPALCPTLRIHRIGCWNIGVGCYVGGKEEKAGKQKERNVEVLRVSDSRASTKNGGAKEYFKEELFEFLMWKVSM